LNIESKNVMSITIIKTKLCYLINKIIMVFAYGC